MPHIINRVSMILFAFSSVGLAGTETAQASAHRATASASSAPVQRAMSPSHVVIVMEENRSYADIRSSANASFIHYLMKKGANFTNYHGVEHPSEPNYLDLFSGSNQGVTDDSVPHTFFGPNLASELLSHHQSFVGYSESLPWMGYQGPTNVQFTYARKHNPWVNFRHLPTSVNQPFAKFPTNFNRLPTVSFVIPNLQHDMHDGSVKMADDWLRFHLSRYAAWAKQHNSLLIVTWDEDDGSAANQIATVWYGAHVRVGANHQDLNHFNLLSTLENWYGLPRLGRSETAQPITSIWK